MLKHTSKAIGLYCLNCIRIRNMQKAKKIIQYLLLFLVILFIGPADIKAAQPFEIHLLDVGQGLSVLIEADGHYMLIDGGGRDSSSFLISYIKQQGVDNLDYIVLSHYDEDHMAGIVGVLTVFHVDTFLVPAYSGQGELYQALATAAISNGCVIKHPEMGFRFQIGNADVEVIGPIGKYSLDNDNSLSVRITYGHTRYLICGDAEQQSETDMVNSSAEIDADVYVVNHHGSKTSTTDAFLDAVSPTYALISCGEDNGYGHPAMETLQRLQNHGIIMFRTDKQGTVIVSSDGTEIWFNVDPCDDWAAGDGIVNTEGTEELVTRQTPAEDTQTTFQYVCNTNTRKFHYSSCNSVNQMKEEHRLYSDLSREDLISQGYEPCGNCKP